MKCEYCGDIIVKLEGKKRVNPKRIFCNESCKRKKKYLRLKENRKSWSKKKKGEFLEKSRIRSTKWRENNRGDYRESMKKYYYENKIDKRDKWNCRAVTAKIFRGKKDFCKKCGVKENLQIHHEIYPKGSKKIREAYLYGKIYFVCYDCHKDIHKNLKRDNYKNNDSLI